METKEKKLNVYSVFHLNIAYSSISEEERPAVIERCYWPLLRLAERFPGSIAVEASGYTLESIYKIDRDWVSALKDLCARGVVQFVGSGYAQIIGPLVPARVNEENLKIGNEVYMALLGMRPTTAYVNEQAYSRSLVGHYKKSGYESIIMEWNNPRFSHPEWPEEYQYYFQRVADAHNESLGLIWNNSIAFQKFQRYVHNEIDIDEYLSYLSSHIGQTPRTFSLYGNDTEIFDFRPGRYKGEAKLGHESEWRRIEALFERLRADSEFSFILPAGVQNVTSPHALHSLSLESSDQPISVKKQKKYNITRWALAGRDNVKINSKCYRIFENLIAAEDFLVKGGQANTYWKELCYLWDSDFRTHIAEERYQAFLLRLEEAWQTSKSFSESKTADRHSSEEKVLAMEGVSRWKEERGRIVVETPSVWAVLQTKSGLAVESLVFPRISSEMLVGTVPHGYYDDITLGDDFMSGHTSIDIPMRPEMTDLGQISELRVVDEQAYIEVSGDILIDAGVIHKTVRIYKDIANIEYTFSFDLVGVSPSSFRSGIVTFIPGSFDRPTLFYGCHNGGVDIEIFSLSESVNINPTPVSLLVSSSTALGNTAGVFVVGDKNKKLFFKTNMSQVAGLPMIQFSDVSSGETFLFRLLYSLGEFNETSFLAKQRAARRFSFTLKIEGVANN